MKSEHFSGGSPLIHESKRTVGEMLKQAYETAMAWNGAPNGRGLPISKEIERRKRSFGAEDPIRTIIFLGSWSHT
ncbi:hypothetical protein L1049_005034 [Liquidambar formosana]|uniref:Uncharacterized protein n=1 Tax=Liquidambar formosana TaxID=63359 RepID=A0AAP0RTM1_LIQFO